MLKENKYYGEVWLRTSEDIKCFCILELIEDQVFLTTNLNDRYKTYQIELIYGMFTGLGYLTFVNCKIKHNSSGIIETTVYQPKYSFICAHHIIEPVNLKLKEFQVENAAIVQWVSKMTWYNAIDEKIEKQEDIVKNLIFQRIYF